MPAINVAPSTATPPATATATATFSVPAGIPPADHDSVRVTLDLLGTAGTSTLNPASITVSAGLSACTLSTPRSYWCQVTDIGTSGVFTISGAIDIVASGGASYPVAESVRAVTSFTLPGGTSQPGPQAATALTVNVPASTSTTGATTTTPTTTPPSPTATTPTPTTSPPSTTAVGAGATLPATGPPSEVTAVMVAVAIAAVMLGAGATALARRAS